MAQRADLLMGPFMRPRFLYATDRSPGRAVSSKLDLRAAHTHEGAHAHTRSTKSRTAAGNSWSNSSAQLRTLRAMSALTSRAQPSAVLKATTRRGCRY